MVPHVPSTDMIKATEELDTGADEVEELVFCEVVLVVVSFELEEDVDDFLDVDSTELLPLLETPQEPDPG